MQKWVTLLLLVALYGVAVHAIAVGTLVAPAAKSLLFLSAVTAGCCFLRRRLLRRYSRKPAAEMGDQRLAAFVLFIGLSVAFISAAFVVILTAGHALGVTALAALCIVLAALCSVLIRV